MDLAQLDPKMAVRNAATTIILRDGCVLMGQRGKNAAFLPGKFVFPGGAVDPSDSAVPLSDMSPALRDGLSAKSDISPDALIAAAVRELWEETGQILGAPGTWKNPPAGWTTFAGTGHIPNAAACQFFFRAVTPAGRPRRFDARFILADAKDLVTDPDDFSKAEDELSHIGWVPIIDACKFDLPFITQVVMAELKAFVDTGVLGPPPFFQNDDERHLVTRLGGASVLGD